MRTLPRSQTTTRLKVFPFARTRAMKEVCHEKETRTMRFSKVLAFISLFGFATVSHANSPKVYADVEVKITDAKLEKQGAGIRTLYITIYDEASKAPMPYGAMKVELKADAKGTIYKGKLDTANIMVMGHGDAPKTLRIKAKLDKDGSAGMDAAGDLVGNATGVTAGSKVTITIDKAI